MDVLDAADELEVELTGLFLRQSGVTHDVVEELATVAVLHDHVQFFFCFDDFVELNHIRVTDLLEDFDLASDAFHIFLVVDLVLLENLDSNLRCHIVVRTYLFAGERVLPKLDLAECSFSEVLA